MTNNAKPSRNQHVEDKAVGLRRLLFEERDQGFSTFLRLEYLWHRPVNHRMEVWPTTFRELHDPEHAHVWPATMHLFPQLLPTTHRLVECYVLMERGREEPEIALAAALEDATTDLGAPGVHAFTTLSHVATRHLEDAVLAMVAGELDTGTLQAHWPWSADDFAIPHSY